MIQPHKFYNLFRMNNSFEVFTESQKVVKTFVNFETIESKKISNDQELIQSDPISCPQNQKENN